MNQTLKRKQDTSWLNKKKKNVEEWKWRWNETFEANEKKNNNQNIRTHCMCNINSLKIMLLSSKHRSGYKMISTKHYTFCRFSRTQRCILTAVYSHSSATMQINVGYHLHESTSICKPNDSRETIECGLRMGFIINPKFNYSISFRSEWLDFGVGFAIFAIKWRNWIKNWGWLLS